MEKYTVIGILLSLALLSFLLAVSGIGLYYYYTQETIIARTSVPGTCPQGYNLQNENCVRPGDYYAAPSILASCPEGEWKNDGTVCRRGSQEYFTTTVSPKCPDNYSFNGITCVSTGGTITKNPSDKCPDGYTDKGYWCERNVVIPSLPVGSEVCPSGYTKQGTLCMQNCKEDYQLDFNRCVRPLTLPTSSFTCPSGYMRKGEDSKCYKICNEGYTNTGEACQRAIDNRKPTCPATHPNLIGTNCFTNCPTGTVEAGTSCKR